MTSERFEQITSDRSAQQIALFGIIICLGQTQRDTPGSPSRHQHPHDDSDAFTAKNASNDRRHSREEGTVSGATDDAEDDERSERGGKGPDDEEGDGIDYQTELEGVERTDKIACASISMLLRLLRAKVVFGRDCEGGKKRT